MMDGGTVYALRVDAGLRGLVAPLVVAFIDEDLVIHVARDDRQLGMRNVFRGKLRVIPRRSLGVACAQSAPI